MNGSPARRLTPGPSEQSETSKLVLLLVLAAAWLLPGLMGHDPWKPRDAATFGVVHSMLVSGDFLVPTLAGEITLDHGPLYFWVAALSARLLGGFLAVHDAARLATGLFMALTLLAIGLAGRFSLGGGMGRPAVVVLLGCVGLLTNGHEMQPEVAVLAGHALALAGFALVLRDPLWGGLLLGLGVGMAFLAGGPVPLVLPLVTALLLPLFPAWRTHEYARGLALALAVSLPWLVLWPFFLAQRAPGLVELFWRQSTSLLADASLRNVPAQLAYYGELLSWFAWPAAPLAAWTLWGYRRRLLSEPRYQLPLVFLVVALTFLASVGSRGDTLALPVLLPLALLAAAGLDTLRRGAANALGWFGIMGFGAAAIFLWVGWFALQTGVPARFSTHLLKLAPGYVPSFAWLPFVVAVLLTAFWALPLRRSFRSGRRAVVHWAAGITLFWGLLATLWLPWLDHNRSYARLFAQLREKLPAQYTCVAAAGLSPAHRALLHYHAGLIPRRVEEFQGMECDLFLLQWNPRTAETRPGPGWAVLWEGSRPGEKKERFRLLRFGGHP